MIFDDDGVESERQKDALMINIKIINLSINLRIFLLFFF